MDNFDLREFLYNNILLREDLDIKKDNEVSSLYFVKQMYGGDEEGGWYYDLFQYSSPEEKIPEGFFTDEEMKTLKGGEAVNTPEGYFKILIEPYPKSMDGTDTYEPYS